MIDVDRGAQIWTIRLNRPDKANALTHDMLASIRDAVREAEGQAKALVLTGAGKVFSAGMDLAEAKSGLPTSTIWDEVSNAIADFSGLTIAALNGTLAGGALGMVLACDLRIAVPTAKIFYPVITAGFLPQPADPPRLQALIGPARARRMLLLGEQVPAETALDWGLIDFTEGHETLLEAIPTWIVPYLEANHGAAIKALLPRV